MIRADEEDADLSGADSMTEVMPDNYAEVIKNKLEVFEDHL